MTIYDNQIVQRKKPINLRTRDEKLFRVEFQKNFQKIYSKEYKDLYVLANGLCLSKDLFFLFYGESKKTFKSKIKVALKTMLVLMKIRRKIVVDNALLLTDHYSGGFFHWFGDVVQKLEALEMAGLDRNSYTLIIPKSFTMEFTIESLKTYNLNYKIVEDSEILLACKLLFVPQIAPTGNYRPELMQNMRKRFKDRYKVEPKQKRVFISRTKALRRTIINESDLTPILKENGFDIITMEDLTFGEQYQRVAEAEILISLHGAGLTHMIWMEEYSKVVEIRAKDDAINNCYFSLASDLNLDYYYLLADKTNEKSTQLTDFRVNSSEFQKIIELITKG